MITLKRKCQDVGDDFHNVIKKKKRIKIIKKTHSEIDILQDKSSTKLMKLSEEVKSEPLAFKDELQKGIIEIDYKFSQILRLYPKA